MRRRSYGWPKVVTFTVAGGAVARSDRSWQHVPSVRDCVWEQRQAHSKQLRFQILTVVCNGELALDALAGLIACNKVH